jgi:hypothetical protein
MALDRLGPLFEATAHRHSGKEFSAEPPFAFAYLYLIEEPEPATVGDPIIRQGSGEPERRVGLERPKKNRP